MAKKKEGKPADKPKAKLGRPSLFSQELVDKICDLISQGVTLSDICREDGMPERRTVYDWINANDDFSARFARARVLGFDAIAEETLHIADTPQIGSVSVSKATGIEITEGDMTAHRKLQVETRLKLLAKWDPKRYGDKIQQDITVTDNTPMADRMKAARERSKKS